MNSLALTLTSFQKSGSAVSAAPACAIRVGDEMNSGLIAPKSAHNSQTSRNTTSVPPPISNRSKFHPFTIKAKAMAVNERFDLSGRSVVITGGGKGIGKVYAEEFAKAGARVVAADIDAVAAENVAAALRQRASRRSDSASISRARTRPRPWCRPRWSASARSTC